MRDRYSAEKARQRRTKRARCVALHDKQVGLRPYPPKQFGGDLLHMSVRILVARAIKAHCSVVLDPEFRWVERGVLIGEHQNRLQPAIAERMSHWCQFDRFRSGADDQPYVGETQSPP